MSLRRRWMEFVWRRVVELPVVEVTFDPFRGTTVHYAGRCHGVIDGREHWSDNGEFAVQCAGHEGSPHHIVLKPEVLDRLREVVSERG